MVEFRWIQHVPERSSSPSQHVSFSREKWDCLQCVGPLDCHKKGMLRWFALLRDL